MKTTSVALGPYFEAYISEKIREGRYNNASEIIRAGLRKLEEEDRLMALRDAIGEGISSGIADDFNPENHLKSLKKS